MKLSMQMGAGSQHKGEKGRGESQLKVLDSEECLKTNSRVGGGMDEEKERERTYHSSSLQQLSTLATLMHG